MSATTLVLIHGTGDTSRVWRDVQDALVHPSVAVDLPGRRDRPFDLTRVSPDIAVAVAVKDIAEQCDGTVVLVADSGSGIVVPRIAGALGDAVCHLVFVVGLVAPHGCLAMDVIYPERHAEFAKARPGYMRRYENHTFVQHDDDLAFVDGLEPLRDAVHAQSVESMNMLFHPVCWTGVGPHLPRTFVRPLGDKLQSREVQQRLIEACAASEVIDIDSGHTPARHAPIELARILDEIADRYPA